MSPSDSIETSKVSLDCKDRVSWQIFCSRTKSVREGAEADGDEMRETDAPDRQFATVLSVPGRCGGDVQLKNEGHLAGLPLVVALCMIHKGLHLRLVVKAELEGHTFQ